VIVIRFGPGLAVPSIVVEAIPIPLAAFVLVGGRATRRVLRPAGGITLIRLRARTAGLLRAVNAVAGTLGKVGIGAGLLFLELSLSGRGGRHGLTRSRIRPGLPGVIGINSRIGRVLAGINWVHVRVGRVSVRVASISRTAAGGLLLWA
jgi:hypothetical protein